MTRKTKHLASISLGVMGAGFVSTLFVDGSIAGRVLQGGFEGGLVGGLADWFAVTALFRHPLGLPIPHTALVVKNRKRITEQFIKVLEQDWLSKESIQAKIQDISISVPIFQALERTETQTMLARAIRAGIENLLHTTDLTQISDWLLREIKTYLQQVDASRIVEAIIQRAIDHEYDIKGFDYLLNRLEGFIEQDSAKSFLGSIAIEALQRAEWDGFMQFAMRQLLNMINEDKIGSILQQLIGKGIRDLQDPNSKTRAALTARIRHELLLLSTKPEFLDELQIWKDAWIESENLRTYVVNGLELLKQRFLSFLFGTRFEMQIIRMIQKGIESIRENSHAVESLERSLQHQIVHFVEENHSKIGELVNENLQKLSDEDLIEMMEDRLGSDLQWIRVNGAVCGWLIGLVIAAIKVLVHP